MQGVLTRDTGHGTRDPIVALLISLALHLAVVALLVLLRHSVSAPSEPPLLDVDVVSLPPPARPAAVAPAPVPAPQAPEQKAPPPVPVPQRQIVSPPDEGKEEEPKSARLLSERNNTVKEQMVRRGEPEPGSAHEPAPPPQPAPPRERPARPEPRSAPARGSRDAAPTQLARAPSLDQLLPNAGQIASQGFGDEGRDEPVEAQPKTERRDVMRYADAFASANNGRRGTMDFLPDVREGDVTLLNTKAELFAPFVRRVAQRVFQSQIITLRRDVPQLGLTTTESAAVEAIMNRKGNLISVRVTEQSATSTISIDRHLQRACQQAFFDFNPPSGAEANDGNIHFVFRTEVQVVATPQGLRNYGALLMAGLM